jgi:hypothetical protein
MGVISFGDSCDANKKLLKSSAAATSVTTSCLKSGFKVSHEVVAGRNLLPNLSSADEVFRICHISFGGSREAL